MWYFAKVQLLPGAAQKLRRELMWGESCLPKGLIGLAPAGSDVVYLFGWCHSVSAASSGGEIEDLHKYFRVLEFAPAEPFFVGESAPLIFATQLNGGVLVLPEARLDA